MTDGSCEPSKKRERCISVAELFEVPEDAAITTSFLEERAAKLCEALLTRCIMHIGRNEQEKLFRITELECYHNDKKAWPDPFTHGDPLQLTSARWYFHKNGGSYKGGTYKGLDITCGIKRTGTYGGLLIRGLKQINTTDDHDAQVHIDGPCLCVDTILSVTQQKSIADFVKHCLPTGEISTSVLGRSAESLWIEDLGHPINSAEPEVLFATPRIGLTFKAKGCTSAINSLKEQFMFARLRVVSSITQSKKGRSHALASLLLCNKSTIDNAARLTGARPQDVANMATRINQAIEEASKIPDPPRKFFSQFYGKDTTKNQWELLFALAQRCGLADPLSDIFNP